MREIRPSGSEGGGTEINRSFLPLSLAAKPHSECRRISPKPADQQALERTERAGFGETGLH
jgi:hypothetical protein